MEDKCKKTFTALDEDIVCECKDIVYPLEKRLIFHNHDGYEMLFMLAGELVLYNEGDARLLKRGDLVLIDEFEFHRGQLMSRDVYDRVVINFRDAVARELSTKETDLLSCFKNRKDSGLNVLHLEEKDIQCFYDCSKRLEEVLADHGFGADILAESALTEILVRTNRISRKQQNIPQEQIMPDVVAKAFDYIENHIADDLSISVLEEELKYNGTYISRSFKKILGMPLQKYIIAKRISVAQKLLREGDTPYNVCFLAGFSNYSNFSRTFKEHIGKSPREYRNEVLGIQ